MIVVEYEKTLWGYVLSFDYDERVVAAIKSRVRPADREWNPGMKVWVITTRAAFDNFRWATNGWIEMRQKQPTKV